MNDTTGRRARPTAVAILAVSLCLLASGVAAAGTEAACSSKQLAIGGKYAACRLKSQAKAVQRSGQPDFSKCNAKLTSQWTGLMSQDVCPPDLDMGGLEELVADFTLDVEVLLALLKQGSTCIRLPATGQTVSYIPGDDGDLQKGAALAYQDNGDGTITDLNTGLMWEKKVGLDETADPDNPHDVDNCYPYYGQCEGTLEICGTDADCAGAGPGGPSGGCLAIPCAYPDSTIDFTIWEWVRRLNVAEFAGYSDWRIPNIRELETITDYGRDTAPFVAPAFHGSGCGPACVELGDPGCSCTHSHNRIPYVSSTFLHDVYEDDPTACGVVHDYPDVGTFCEITVDYYAGTQRAVRGGGQ